MSNGGSIQVLSARRQEVYAAEDGLENVADALEKFYNGDVPAGITVRLRNRVVPEGEWNSTSISAGDAFVILEGEVASEGMKGAA